jgi:FixJ family two-component response regulator
MREQATSPTVYVIDSNTTTRESTSRLLTAMQFSVEEFPTAEEFLARPKTDVGCVVSELRLGGISGLELQSHLQREASILPVVFVAERASTPLIVRAMRQGAIAFLDQPANEDDLWLAVREAIAENADRHQCRDRNNRLRARFSKLSEPELAVLQKVREGRTNKEIAAKLDVSIRTVESRRRRILEKTSTSTFPDLIVVYEEYKNVCREKSSSRIPAFQPRSITVPIATAKSM